MTPVDHDKVISGVCPCCLAAQEHTGRILVRQGIADGYPPRQARRLALARVDRLVQGSFVARTYNSWTIEAYQAAWLRGIDAETAETIVERRIGAVNLEA